VADTVVVGLGSPLMGDDGLGLCALEAVRAAGRFTPEPEWVDGGTWGMNLLPHIEGARRLLLLDAIRAGRAPGEAVVLPREALPRGLGLLLSPHQIDLQEVLALAELRGTLPVEALAMGLEPERVELGCGLSESVRRGMDALVCGAVRQLEAWGHRFEPAAVATPTPEPTDLAGLRAGRLAARGPDAA
jgi:hydrogenase maturation protease